MRTQGNLNDTEAANILEGRRAIRSPSLDDITDDLWLRRLHKLMFGDVWSWAGTYRLSDRNIGIDWTSISVAVRGLVDDCEAWAAFDRTKVPVARFHHCLVTIHPFPNGNGRHARAATDYLCGALGLSQPTWGGKHFREPHRTANRVLARPTSSRPRPRRPRAARQLHVVVSGSEGFLT